MKKLAKRYPLQLFVYHGKHCLKGGSHELARALRGELKARGVKLRLSRSSCLGECGKRCVVVAQGPTRVRWWGELRPEAARKLAAKLAKMAETA